MKIPENPYYGNEENTQWQPNGVIIDSGVGGGVVGSGDAGARPVYPVHIPRHIPAGYVMGAYYPPYAAPPPVPDDFADYMWMENEEEFDKQVMQQLEEEALMEQCIEAMLEDEQRERHRTVSNGHCATTSTGSCNLSLEETVSRSTLNPLAAEFVPSRISQTSVQSEEKKENQEVRTDDKKEDGVKEEKAVAESTTDTLEEPNPPQPNPPQPAEEQPESPPVVTEAKKKPEVKSKTKQSSKSETKVGLKKTIKNESRIEEKIADVMPATEETGFKPINYAAAAKANKPKKPEQEKPKSDKPAEKPKSDKPAEKPKADKPAKPADKDKKPLKEKPKVKPEKPVQRKNSTK